MFYFATAVLAVSGIMSLIRQYQMLQQNSYFAKRYFGWIRSDIKPITLIIRLVMFGLLIWAVVLSEEMLKNSLTLFAACSLYFGWRGVSDNSNSI